MSFFLQKVFRKLWRNSIIYTVLALELALGIAFLVYAVSTKISVEEPIKFYQERYPETLVELTTNHGAAALQQVTAKDIAMLREILPGFTLKTKVQAFFFEPVEGKLKNNFAVYLLPPGLADGQAYYGAELAKALQEKPVLIDLIGRYQLTQTELWDTLANLRLPASPLPKEYARVTDTTNPGGRPTDGENTQYTYAYSDSLFLPQTYAEQARSGSFTNYLWDTAGSEDAELMQKKALDYLASQYPDIDFLFQYPGQQLAEVTGDMSAAAQMLGPIAWVLLAEMTIGFTGVILLFLQRRKKELAICMALGAACWPKSFWQRLACFAPSAAVWVFGAAVRSQPCLEGSMQGTLSQICAFARSQFCWVLE